MGNDLNIEELSQNSKDFYNKRGAEFLCHLARKGKDETFLLIMQHADLSLIDSMLEKNNDTSLSKTAKIYSIREQFYNEHPWRTGDLKSAPYFPNTQLLTKYETQFSLIMENIFKNDKQAWAQIASLADRELNQYEDNSDKAYIRSARRNFGEI